MVPTRLRPPLCTVRSTSLPAPWHTGISTVTAPSTPTGKCCHSAAPPSSPGQTTAAQDTYDAGCERLGVVARDEGWALWHTWDDQGRPCTVVTTRPGHHPGPAGQLVPWPGHASRTATTGSDRCGARPLARADHVLTQPCHQGRPRRTLHRPDPAPSAENASECPDLRSKQARQNMLGAAHMCRCQCAVGYRGLVTLRR